MSRHVPPLCAPSTPPETDPRHGMPVWDVSVQYAPACAIAAPACGMIVRGDPGCPAPPLAPALIAPLQSVRHVAPVTIQSSRRLRPITFVWW
ncbi:hypothetical protein [Komagataeibacter saccharivorans]|uniref:hypothetical protein n=1 Tax=Komagataeibacter saccharivorans TaxID=265959 RepID=UPI0011AFADE1|nr:hypothetical protein [Komagataeibacter saccharivorans]